MKWELLNFLDLNGRRFSAPKDSLKSLLFVFTCLVHCLQLLWFIQFHHFARHSIQHGSEENLVSIATTASILAQVLNTCFRAIEHFIICTTWKIMNSSLSVQNARHWFAAFVLADRRYFCKTIFCNFCLRLVFMFTVSRWTNLLQLTIADGLRA